MLFELSHYMRWAEMLNKQSTKHPFNLKYEVVVVFFPICGWDDSTNCEYIDTHKKTTKPVLFPWTSSQESSSM